MEFQAANFFHVLPPFEAATALEPEEAAVAATSPPAPPFRDVVFDAAAVVGVFGVFALESASLAVDAAVEDVGFFPGSCQSRVAPSRDERRLFSFLRSSISKSDIGDTTDRRRGVRDPPPKWNLQMAS